MDLWLPTPTWNKPGAPLKSMFQKPSVRFNVSYHKGTRTLRALPEALRPRSLGSAPVSPSASARLTWPRKNPPTQQKTQLLTRLELLRKQQHHSYGFKRYWGSNPQTRVEKKRTVSLGLALGTLYTMWLLGSVCLPQRVTEASAEGGRLSFSAPLKDGV